MQLRRRHLQQFLQFIKLLHGAKKVNTVDCSAWNGDLRKVYGVSSGASRRQLAAATEDLKNVNIETGYVQPGSTKVAVTKVSTSVDAAALKKAHAGVATLLKDTALVAQMTDAKAANDAATNVDAAVKKVEKADNAANPKPAASTTSDSYSSFSSVVSMVVLAFASVNLF